MQPIKRYVVATYIPEAARRAAARASYVVVDAEWPGVLRALGPPDGAPAGGCRCPLGVVLRELGDGLTWTPSAEMFASALLRLQVIRPAQQRGCELAAATFIRDFDAGQIRPEALSVALGVAP